MSIMIQEWVKEVRERFTHKLIEEERFLLAIMDKFNRWFAFSFDVILFSKMVSQL